MRSAAFERFGGLTAVLAAISGFLYSVAFIVVARRAPALGNLLSGLFLLLGGLLGSAALVALFQRLREADAGFALWGTVLALAGALGSAVHGGYDLSNALHPAETYVAAQANLPSQVDPRGLLTFGVAGVGLLVLSWLIGRGLGFPRGLGLLGYLLGALLIVIYLGRLIVLQATHPVIVIPALLAGFVVNPLWYLWLGATLWRGHGAESAPGIAAQMR